MKTADFDFDLPSGLIALRPSEKRDNSRLLVLHRDGSVEHKRFFDVPGYMSEGDMLLLNDTRVFPARIIAIKPNGRQLDILLVRETDEKGTWEAIYRGKFSGVVTFGNGMRAQVWPEKNPRLSTNSPEMEVENQKLQKKMRFLDVELSMIPNMLQQFGYMPLPPYIKRMPDDEDKERYQTVYAERTGSIAAPTAGLHFTEELLDKVKERGVLVRSLTLHVGTGTFKPVKAEMVEGHTMDMERFSIRRALIEEIGLIKARGKRVITVGTTATRTVEGYFNGQWIEDINPGLQIQRSDLIRGHTDIFISPGYKFSTVDSLITNFHLPCSTPLMLASAFSSLEKIFKAYREAISMGYRFFSYGDAMLIL